MRQLKKRKSVIVQTVDRETGEVLDQSVKYDKYFVGTKDDFFLCYSALIGVFMEMSQAEIRIFGYCLKFVKGVKFDISKRVRVSMSSEISVNERVILNTLPSLEEKGLLYKHADGLYQVNPRYAFAGSSDKRDEALKVIIELGCKDC
jgi:hypothetical protein